MAASCLGDANAGNWRVAGWVAAARASTNSGGVDSTLPSTGPARPQRPGPRRLPSLWAGFCPVP
eukprot:2159977-Lingulodinium_polyedra.AAC.1